MLPSRVYLGICIVIVLYGAEVQWFHEVSFSSFLGHKDGLR